jgi:serine/threonine-protein kinase RsbT
MAREELNLTVVLLELCHIRSNEEVVQARLAVKVHARDLSFSTVNQTKLMTAASELARNVLEHGLGGDMRIEQVESATGSGVRLTFTDKGPGIPDLELALTDGYTSKKGMGLGLPGSKRLMDEFEIKSGPDGGTTVIATKWK